MSDMTGDPGGGGGDIASDDHGGRDAGTALSGRQAASHPACLGPECAVMQIHGSCACRAGDGVLLIGSPGAGKSDLVLRLLARGFDLVADDRVDIVDGMARPVPALAGLLEVRGLGIVRLAYVAAGAAGPGRGTGQLPPRGCRRRHCMTGWGCRWRGSMPGRPRRRRRFPWRWTVRSAASRRSPEPSPHERRQAARRSGHRPVRRRQGVGAAGAGGRRIRGGRQPAAADARGHGDAQRAEAGDRCGCPHARLRRQPGARRRWIGCASIPRCGRNWSTPGPTKRRCCGATPRRSAAIRWRRRGGWPTASRARRS